MFLPWFHKTFRLDHVNVFFQVAIKECRGDVHMVDLQVFDSSNSQNGAKGGELCNRGKVLYFTLFLFNLGSL